MFHLQCVHITNYATYNSGRPGALLSSKYLFSLLPVDPPQATLPHNTQLLLDRNLSLSLSLKNKQTNKQNKQTYKESMLCVDYI